MTLISSDRTQQTAGLLLSPQLQYLLEAQAVKERILDRGDYSLGECFDVPPLYRLSSNRQAILPYLALYPEFRATRSDFVLDRLSQTGLKVRVEEPGLVRHLNYAIDWHDLKHDDQFVRLLSLAHEEACRFCLRDHKRLTALLRGLIGPDQIDSLYFGRQDDDHGDRCTNLFTLLLPRILRRLRTWYADGLVGSIFQDSQFFDIVCPELDEAGLLSHPYFEALLGKLDDYYTRLVAELFISSHERAHFGTLPWFARMRSNKPVSSSKVQPAIELLHVRFAHEVRILPAPRTLTEAAEMGQSRKVKRLKRKIEHWMKEVGPDKSNLEKKIRRDIASAARDLRTLRTYREYKESPLVFGLKAVGGQIPLIANVVTLAETLGWAYERCLDRRSCWVTINSPNSPG